MTLPTPPQESIVIHLDPTVRPLIPSFLARRHQDLAFIAQKLEGADFQGLERLGHNLKGVGRGYGFDGISVIGKAIEHAAQHRDAAEIRLQRAALADYLQRVRIAP